MISGNSSQLNMGVSSSSNTLNVSNGAYVYTQGGTGGTGTWTIGTNSGANSNSISVSGTGSVLRNALGAFLHVGNAGSSNSLSVSSGGTWHGSRAPQMGAGGGDNNSVTFTGSNSLCYVNGGSNGWFQIGSDAASVGATGNNFDVLSGAKFNLTGTGTTRQFSIGKTAGSDNNRLRISGSGSTANVNFALPIGVGVAAVGTSATLGGSSNVLDVLDGAALTTVTPIYVGSGTSVGAASASTNNVINLGAGTANTASITVNASATQFNTQAGYDGAWTVPGTTTPIAAQSSSYTVPGVGSLTTQGIFLVDSTSALNINNGRLIAGDSFGSSTQFVSGPGSVTLAGPAYFRVPASSLNATISSAISGSGSLTKETAGTLILSGVNTYTGDTTALGGELRLSSAFLADSSSVFLSTGSFLNLAFSSSDTVDKLFFDGVQQAAGTYNATSNPDFFLGNGSLVVTAGVPEPATIALAAVAGLAVVALGRRRQVA
ncbi:MAG: hypothetical protein FJ284_11515 [Planctomycetes bacterium]|nr:hypothetical protein [Planctomycetota bacterium]